MLYLAESLTGRSYTEGKLLRYFSPERENFEHIPLSTHGILTTPISMPHEDNRVSPYAALLNGLKICKISIFRRCSWDVKLSIGWSEKVEPQGDFPPAVLPSQDFPASTFGPIW